MNTSNPPKRLSELLYYNPDTGKFQWTTHVGRVRAGEEAGVLKDGYIAIRLDGVIYYAHRLAWYVMTNEWLNPKQEVDHINGDKSDNRLSNLRQVTSSQNKLNRNNRLHISNTSGHRGVTWSRSRNRWQAQIHLNDRCVFLGRFVNLEDAIAARKTADQAISLMSNKGAQPWLRKRKSPSVRST